jgi:hypothetical protein
MQQIISRILENVSGNREDYALLETGSDKIKIGRERFFDITPCALKTVNYIDGGNLEILRSPSISLFFNRVCCTTYTEKRAASRVIEFFTLISAFSKSERIFFRTECFFTKGELDIKKYEFDSFDSTLTTGNRRAQISKIGDVIRRFSELVLAKTLDGIIVIDGTLEPVYTYEDMLIAELKDKSLCAVSKTNSLLTESGRSLSACLEAMTEKKTWYYFLTKSHADIYFAKLNPRSEYVFRIETAGCLANEIMYALMQNSRDAVFPGYPYGLIEADMFARVSRREKESLMLQLKVRLKKDFDRIRPYINSLNAHDILDSIG